MTTTPPLLSITEPPTPLHGSRYNVLDSQTVRRSPRFAQYVHHRTPSPDESRNIPQSQSTANSRRKINPRILHRYSPPSSPLSPPRMRRANAGSATVRGSKNVESESLAAGISHAGASMLPTPAKTPRKRDIKQTVNSTARVLFPHRPETADEVMPTPRKRARHGLSLESFADEDGAQPEIKIFTDSKDKVPEVDLNTDNPFYVQEGRATRVERKKKDSEHKKLIQEALERDDGMVYVFRGKKVYRKFEDINYDEPEGGEAALKGLPIEELESHRPFTRSSVKPRFLFAKDERRSPKHAGYTTDEEAVTDIEDATLSSAARAGVETGTPIAEELTAPATPPSTNRTKRVIFHDSITEADKDIEDSCFTVKKARRASPFDDWRRTKTGGDGTSARSKKRVAAEDLAGNGDGKRTKSKG